MKLSLFALLVVASASAVYAVEPSETATKRLVKLQEEDAEVVTTEITEEPTLPVAL